MTFSVPSPSSRPLLDFVRSMFLELFPEKLQENIFLELISPKLHITYSFVIQRITWTWSVLRQEGVWKFRGSRRKLADI